MQALIKSLRILGIVYLVASSLLVLISATIFISHSSGIGNAYSRFVFFYSPWDVWDFLVVFALVGPGILLRLLANYLQTRQEKLYPGATHTAKGMHMGTVAEVTDHKTIRRLLIVFLPLGTAAALLIIVSCATYLWTTATRREIGRFQYYAEDNRMLDTSTGTLFDLDHGSWHRVAPALTRLLENE